MALGGFTCSKNALAALNVLYILVAFMLIGFASWGKYVAILTDLKALSGIIACGVFLLFVALIGLVGALKHHQVMLFFYMVILFLIFLFQFIMACVCLAINADQQKKLFEVGWSKANDDAKLAVQKKFNCCGLYDQNFVNSTDPLAHPACNKSSPDICTPDRDETCCTGVPGDNTTSDSCPVQTTCWTEIESVWSQALKASGGIGLFFSFTEILGVWLAMRFRNQKDPRANPSAFL